MLRSFLNNDPTWALLGEMDRHFNSVWKEHARPLIRPEQLGPQVYFEDTDDRTRIVAEVPGVNADDIQLSADRETLTLQVERRLEEPEGKQALRRERRNFAWKRSFRFRHPIDADRVEAKLDGGLLTIELRRAPEVEPRRIQVKTS